MRKNHPCLNQNTHYAIHGKYKLPRNQRNRRESALSRRGNLHDNTASGEFRLTENVAGREEHFHKGGESAP